MAEKTRTQTQQDEPLPEDHLPGGENPMNVPVHQLDASPPQPDVAQDAEIASQQDQKPLQPDPLLNRVEEKAGKQRELRNG